MIKIYEKNVGENSPILIWKSKSEHITDLVEWALLEEYKEFGEYFKITNNHIYQIVQELLEDYFNDAEPDLIEAVADLISMVRKMDNRKEYFIKITKTKGAKNG